MSRMNRLDWLAATTRPASGQEKERFLKAVKWAMKRRMMADGLIAKPDTPRFEWQWCTADGTHGGTVRANTKGEARAELKKQMGTKELPKVNFSRRTELRESTSTITLPAARFADAG